MSIEDLLEEYRDNDYYNLHKIENITKLCEEIERLNKELESWIKLIDYKGIEDIPQYVSDLEVDNKQLKEENQLLNKNYNIINELEKCINERIKKTKIEPIREKERNRILYNLNVIYNRLQELKGSDKE